MSRTIKFRAWDKERKEMCVVSSLEFLFESMNGICANVPNDDHSPDAPLFRDIFPENLELMQFTGLTDRNGKEIYEGDIVVNTHCVKVNHTSFKVWRQIPATKRAVAWRQIVTNTGFNLGLPKNGETHIEVIGNIYENPDLLNP
jgi:uncharacterized phage protein (TIGR01671 family)